MKEENEKQILYPRAIGLRKDQIDKLNKEKNPSELVRKLLDEYWKNPVKW